MFSPQHGNVVRTLQSWSTTDTQPLTAANLDIEGIFTKFLKALKQKVKKKKDHCKPSEEKQVLIQQCRNMTRIRERQNRTIRVCKSYTCEAGGHEKV